MNDLWQCSHSKVLPCHLSWECSFGADRKGTQGTGSISGFSRNNMSITMHRDSSLLMHCRGFSLKILPCSLHLLLCYSSVEKSHWIEKSHLHKWPNSCHWKFIRHEMILLIAVGLHLRTWHSTEMLWMVGSWWPGKAREMVPMRGPVKPTWETLKVFNSLLGLVLAIVVTWGVNQ